MNYLPNNLNNRIKLFLIIVLVQCLLFFIVRSALALYSFEQIDWTLKNITTIFCIGLLYDLSFLMYFNSILILFLFCLPEFIFQRKWGFALFLILLAVLSSILLFSSLAEWFFWDEFNVRYNFVAVDYLVYATEVVNNIKESYPYKTILGSLLIASILIIVIPSKHIYLSFKSQVTLQTKLKFISIYFGIFSIVLFLINQNMRDKIKNNFTKELASNGPYQFFNAYKDNKIEYRRFYRLGDDEMLSKTLKKLTHSENNADLYDISKDITSIEPEKKFNVILISVESLSASFMERFGNNDHITPYLDNLAKESLLFSNFYATGTRTVRGLESISLALPPTPGQAIVRRPDNHGFDSMGSIFSDHGYDSVFLYGGYGFFDNMNNFFAGNGYRIIDRSDFLNTEKTFTNAWGVADEDLFNKTLQAADADFNKNQPFFFHIMTVSNHRPYTYPDNKIDIPSHTSRSGAVKYTDYAIGNFIKNAKSKKWFDSTVFVIVADHCASSAGKIGLDINSYHIPLIIYCPALINASENTKVSSQIDIAPTIFNLLHFRYQKHFLGEDILSDAFVDRTFISNYQKVAYLKHDTLCILSLKQSVEYFSYDGKNMKIARPKNNELLNETMAYYQGTDYILEHRKYRRN